MQPRYDTKAMARELQEGGFDAAQAARYDFAFEATKVAAVCVLCAKYGTSEAQMMTALKHSRNLSTEACRLVARVEVSPAFVGYIHSALAF
jgi:hypothetical protein